MDVIAPVDGSQLPVFDAVGLPDRTALVAAGDTGLLLIGPDGRTEAYWDVPVHQVVLDDSGTNAVLVHRDGPVSRLARLDLTADEIHPGPARELPFPLLPSYDGDAVVTADEQGLVALDLLADPPVVRWRGPDGSRSVLALNRTAQRLSAVIAVPVRDGPVGLWSWELPSMELRLRRDVEFDPATTQIALSGDTLVALSGEGGPSPQLTWFRADQDPLVTATRPDIALRSSGAALLTVHPDGDGWRCALDVGPRADAVHAAFPAGSAGRISVREHAGAVLLRDTQGRLLYADPATGASTAFTRSG
jgi:hypothetical protein